MTEKIQIQLTKNLKSKPSAENLGFGQYFTDHMFNLDYSSARGWHSPRVVPYSSFSLDPGAAVFHYGQALFEGLKAFRGVDGKVRLFRPEFNCLRLQEGAKRLCIPPIDTELALESLLATVRVDKDWVPSHPQSSLYLRPTIIATEPFLGVRPSNEYLFFVIMSPVGNYYSEGTKPLRIWVEDQLIRAAEGGLGAVKAGANYASSLLAAYTAKAKGYSQVLWLDAREKKLIEEVGTMNVFFRIADEVVTPALNGSILSGGTRESALVLLKDMGIKTSERAISIDEIYEAHKKGTLKEAFGTGTAAVISPIGELCYKEQRMAINQDSPGELAKSLYKSITDIQYGRAEDKHGWMIPI